MSRPRKFDERHVLELARDQFWATGYAGTRMEEIAGATGLGKGSLYGAFGDKTALFHRVFADWCRAIVELAEQRLTGPGEEAYARLSAYVQLMVANTAADIGHRGCLMAKGTAELAEHDEVVAARSAETMSALLALLRREIIAAQVNGDIDDTADPEQLAALLLVVLRGIEAVGKAGLDARVLKDMASTTLALLPRSPARTRRPLATVTPHAPNGNRLDGT